MNRIYLWPIKYFRLSNEFHELIFVIDSTISSLCVGKGLVQMTKCNKHSSNMKQINNYKLFRHNFRTQPVNTQVVIRSVKLSNYGGRKSILCPSSLNILKWK